MDTITLLNGTVWNKAEILEKMEDDSFYYGYLGQNALSSSSDKKLLESPKTYKMSLNTSSDSKALREGRLIHLSILEPHRLDELVIIDSSTSTNKFKDAVAEHGAHLVYTAAEMNNASWIAKAVANNRECRYLLDDCMFERPAIGEVDGLAHRAKADALSDSFVLDVKTTSAKVEDFRWEAKKYNYALQAALYLELFQRDAFIYLVVNKYSKDIGIFTAGPDFIDRGREDVFLATEVYKKFFINADNSDELINNYVYKETLLVYY